MPCDFAPLSWQPSGPWRRRYVRFMLVLLQAEDGIRDDLVTGVQTCALPIYFSRWARNARSSSSTRSCTSRSSQCRRRQSKRSRSENEEVGNDEYSTCGDRVQPRDEGDRKSVV